MYFFGKVGLSIGLWFISEGVKKIGLDMVLPGDTFGDILIQMFALGRVNYPHNCHTLDLTKDSEVEEKGLQRIWFEFENLTKKASNTSIEVRLQGFNWAGTAEGLYSSTEAIRFTPKEHRKYSVQVIQGVFVEADKARNCGNYPHGGFSSYRSCDDEFQRKSLESLAPGLVPVWLADHLDQVTTHMVKPQTLKGKPWVFSVHLVSHIIHKLTLRGPTSRPEPSSGS